MFAFGLVTAPDPNEARCTNHFREGNSLQRKYHHSLKPLISPHKPKVTSHISHRMNSPLMIFKCTREMNQLGEGRYTRAARTETRRGKVGSRGWLSIGLSALERSVATWTSYGEDKHRCWVTFGYGSVPFVLVAIEMSRLHEDRDSSFFVCVGGRMEGTCLACENIFRDFFLSDRLFFFIVHIEEIHILNM